MSRNNIFISVCKQLFSTLVGITIFSVGLMIDSKTTAAGFWVLGVSLTSTGLLTMLSIYINCNAYRFEDALSGMKIGFMGSDGTVYEITSTHVASLLKMVNNHETCGYLITHKVSNRKWKIDVKMPGKNFKGMDATHAFKILMEHRGDRELLIPYSAETSSKMYQAFAIHKVDSGQVQRSSIYEVNIR